ncbi:MFS transporter [Numidum massiliense]|uniref:MFS transporter n=1 Tax=Numidum massiliense TaxID=1522315 RepID=UPI0006D5788D|nr:MFS transporter [Numidum massiliense]
MDSWRRNVWILAVAQFLVMAGVTMVIPFLPLYLRDLGVTDPDKVQIWAGFIFGINFFSAFLVSPIWGTLADKYGRKLMVIRSGIGMSITIVLMGLATSPVHLLLLRFVNGLISGFMPAAIALTATNTPKHRVGYALGILQAGGVSGSIMGPLFGGLLAEWIGFRAIFTITGFVILAATMVVLFKVTELHKPDPSKVKRASVRADAALILHNKSLVPLFTVAFLIQFAMMGPSPLMSLFVLELGAPGGYVVFFAGLVTAVTGLANIMAAPQLGKLGDKYGSQYVLMAALIGAGLFSIPHAFVSSVWELLIWRFMLGLFIGGLLPALNSLISRHAPEGKESAAYGYSNSAVALGNMLGPITGGYVANWIGIEGLFLVTAALLLINSVWFRFSFVSFKRKAIRSS